ncbi:hypothetical protein LAW29_24765, partial [Escherichia coli]|nr:hypothetical protein [Escherichia coli]
GGKNSLNRLIRCVCGKKIGPDPRNFNQRVSLGRNDLLIRTFPNQGTTVGMEKVRNSVASRVLRETRTHKNSSHGKFSTKSTEVNGLRSDFGNSGSGYRTSRSEPFDAGHNYFHCHHSLADDTPARTTSCLSGWDADGHDSSSTCDSGSSFYSD